MQSVMDLRFSSRLALLVALLLAGFGLGTVQAQATPISLTVQLRSTVANAPVPRVAVKIVDAASNHLLAQGVTDARGQAHFAQMPPTEVRVRLSGALPDGTPLRPTPQDTEGIWVRLPGRDWLMDLRADVDGLVFPDLSAGSAGAPDARDALAAPPGATASSSAAVYPTAPLAQASTSAPVSRPPAITSSMRVGEASVSRSAAASTSNLPGALLLALLVGMIGGVLWLTARSKL
jgi:hypothetical protein